MRDSASRFMLDTDCCVALLRGQAPRAVDRLRKLGLERVHLSAVTVGELLTCAARSRSPLESTVRVVRFCASLQVVSFDDRAAATYARARAALEERGTTIGPLDTLIAGHALALGVTLVTGNTREFGRIAGLTLENWVKPSG